MTRSSRLAVAAAIAAFACLAIALAGRIPSRHVRGDPGPQAFPIAVAAVVLLGAAAALLGEIRGREAGAEPATGAGPAPGTGSAPGAGPAGPARVVAAATAGYLALMVLAGFVVATALFLAAISFYLDRDRQIRSLIHLLVAAGAAVALWLIFSRLLDVILPRGLVGV